MAANEIIVVDQIKTDSYKTKTMVNMLSAVGAGKKSLVVLDTVDEIVIKSFANIPGVKTVQANQLNVYDVLNCNTYIMTKAAAAIVEEVYGK
jgi:large subunit ribosomal protein L4